MIVGTGDFRYEVVEGWEQIPNGWRHGDVAGVATDDDGRVYVFNRSEHPMLVYDRDGRFIENWGEDTFSHAHGVTYQHGVLFCADDGDHTVRICHLDGTVLKTLGNPNQPSETGYNQKAPGNLTTIQRSAGPFHRPTRLHVAPNGEMFVSDGYGNARIHRFDANGELLSSWGEPGRGPGQFMLPHSVWVHTDGRVFVCDRENDRVQIFSPDGEVLAIWDDVRRPGDLFIDANNHVYIGEMYHQCGAQSIGGQIWEEDLPAQLSIRDIDGREISRFGGEGDPTEPGNLVSPHGIWVDDRGDIYVGEVTQTSMGNRGAEYLEHYPTLRKFVRIR